MSSVGVQFQVWFNRLSCVFAALPAVISQDKTHSVCLLGQIKLIRSGNSHISHYERNYSRTFNQRQSWTSDSFLSLVFFFPGSGYTLAWGYVSPFETRTTAFGFITTRSFIHRGKRYNHLFSYIFCSQQLLIYEIPHECGSDVRQSCCPVVVQDDELSHETFLHRLRGSWLQNVGKSLAFLLEHGLINAVAPHPKYEKSI